LISKLSADNFPSRIVSFDELPSNQRSHELPNVAVAS